MAWELDHGDERVASILSFWKEINRHTTWRSADVSVVLSNQKSYTIRQSKPGKEWDFVRECKTLQYLRDKNLKHFPQIIWISERHSMPIAILEYIEGLLLWDQENLEWIDYTSVVDGLIELNSIGPIDNSWGKHDWIDPEKWSFIDFNTYLQKRYISKIQESPFLSKGEVEQIHNSIKAILVDIRPELNKRKPVMIHGDANPWNIIVDRDNSARWIDFWEARYSLPEEDFARLWVFKQTRWIAPKLIDAYSEKSWRELDLKLIKLFALCIVAGRLSKNNIASWEQEWKNLVSELLKP